MMAKRGAGEERTFDICQRTFEFALRIVRICRDLDQKPGVSRTLSRQLLRSGTSVGANVEEGQAGQSRADFISKYSIARKEARETKYWLRLLLGSGMARPSEIDPAITECGELIKILTTIILKAKGK